MNGGKNIVGKQYQDLYADYYSNPSETSLKRKISAEQTLDCMTKVLRGAVFNKLLDVGAGDGSVLAQMGRKAIAREFHAVEISNSGVDAIKAQQIPLLHMVQAFDGYEIPYPDKYFDIAIAIHVLEHVEHERLFLREMSRVSRHVYIEVPLEHGYRVQRSIDNGKKHGHINFYTKETLRSVLESAGLKVLDCRAVPASLKYEQHLSGHSVGWIKNAVRRSALKLVPNLAPWFLVYNGYAYCECG